MVGTLRLPTLRTSLRFSRWRERKARRSSGYGTFARCRQRRDPTAALTLPKIVIKYNYSGQEVIAAHGKRLHRIRGSIRPAQDRAERRGADPGPQPPRLTQSTEKTPTPPDPSTV